MREARPGPRHTRREEDSVPCKTGASYAELRGHTAATFWPMWLVPIQVQGQAGGFVRPSETSGLFFILKTARGPPLCGVGESGFIAAREGTYTKFEDCETKNSCPHAAKQ